MSALFLTELKSEGLLFDSVLTRATSWEIEGFADLCWDQHTIDYSALSEDPGIQLIISNRTVALMRMNEEIRYYAGPYGENANDADFEIGILPSVPKTVAFVKEYLVDRHRLASIEIERTVRYPRPPSEASETA